MGESRNDLNGGCVVSPDDVEREGREEGDCTRTNETMKKENLLPHLFCFAAVLL